MTGSGVFMFADDCLELFAIVADPAAYMEWMDSYVLDERGQLRLVGCHNCFTRGLTLVLLAMRSR